MPIGAFFPSSPASVSLSPFPPDSVSSARVQLFSGHFVARYPSPALLRCCLQLYVGAIRHLEVTPHPSSGCLAPPEALSGVTECRGAFGASGSLTVCCILWTPLEDPFEVFSISQGTYWLPGWGRRVTAAVSTRPCRKQNALGQDDAEVQQDLEIAVSSSLSNSLKTEKAETGASSSVVAASAEFDGGTPIAFLSVLHIHQRLAHDLSIETHPFRGADPWTSPHNVMSNKATPYVPKKPCISILGTAILPLAHLLATSRKSVQRVDCMRKEREGLLSVTVGMDGKIKLMTQLKLFKHEVRSAPRRMTCTDMHWLAWKSLSYLLYCSILSV
ncbi:uncharacterized protein LOC113147532 [Cyclospora cayetanensis]|uniref:Uncharacterized protein LOC113147532 n=1 Tax=Cyclospora cayetanensis TaxID=88456 RepID=A0A6P6S2Y6_9EIME|nr:uncharacterized protein LOC113147532 [Cyclospora cayetanensis]